jgi:DNA (cytosine-5)-methyltransferase 1
MTLLDATNLQGKPYTNCIRSGGRGSLTDKHNWDLVRINHVQVGTLRTHKDGEGFREIKSGICPTIPARAREDGSGQPCVAVLTPDRLEKRQNGRRFKDDGEPAFTLTSQDKHGVMLDKRIRRLTEIECERLQGFPDDFTALGDFEGCPGKKISATQRYKMLGNSVSVPVVQAVGESIIKVMR